MDFPKSNGLAKSRGRRARHLVLEGARSRAVVTSTSDMAVLTSEQEVNFANDLLPRSTRPDVVFE